MSTVVEIKKAIENLAPPEREDLTRWLLQSDKSKADSGEIHPEVLKMTGIAPREMNAESEFHQHQLQKHR